MRWLLFVMLVPAAFAAVPGPIDYMPMFTNEYVTGWIDRAGLRNWQSEDAKIGPKFLELRTDFVKTLREGCEKAGITLPAGELPQPRIHRMIFNLFKKKANFMMSTGDHVAFMAKVFLDNDHIKYQILDAPTDLNKAITSPIAAPTYNLNCYGFVWYCCYMAGLPEYNADTVPGKDKARIAPHQQLISPEMFLSLKASQTVENGWRGWYVPHYGGAEGWPYSPNGVVTKPGDLLSLYVQSSTKQKIFSHFVPGAFTFFHVEVIVKPDTADGAANTLTIGNSGKKPHYTYMLGKKYRLMSWLDENWPELIAFTKNAAWKIVVYKFIDRFQDGKVPPHDKLVLD